MPVQTHASYTPNRQAGVLRAACGRRVREQTNAIDQRVYEAAGKASPYLDQITCTGCRNKIVRAEVGGWAVDGYHYMGVPG